MSEWECETSEKQFWDHNLPVIAHTKFKTRRNDLHYLLFGMHNIHTHSIVLSYVQWRRKKERNHSHSTIIALSAIDLILTSPTGPLPYKIPFLVFQTDTKNLLLKYTMNYTHHIHCHTKFPSLCSKPTSKNLQLEYTMNYTHHLLTCLVFNLNKTQVYWKGCCD